MTTQLDEFITTAEFAKMAKVKPNTAEIWRHQGKGPPFCKMGDGPGAAVRYRRSDILAWIEKRIFASTSASTAANAAQPTQPRVVELVRRAPMPNAPWL